MKVKLLFTLTYIFVLINLGYCQLLSNLESKSEWAYFYRYEELSQSTFFSAPPPNPPACSTQYISLENPFRGFNESIAEDIGFVNRYSSDNITANNICEYYSSIYQTKSINHTNHNIGFENGNLSGWVRIKGNNYKNVTDYKCGQLSRWEKAEDTSSRFEVTKVESNRNDPYGGNLLKMKPPGFEENQYFLKLGKDNFESEGNIIFRKIRIYKDNPVLRYSYGLIMGDYPHNYCHAPYFRAILLNQDCQIIECASQTVNPVKNGQRMVATPVSSMKFLSLENRLLDYHIVTNKFVQPAQGKVAPWTSMVINTHNYFVNSNNQYEDFTIAFITSACAGNMDMSYAYVDLEVGATSIYTSSANNCSKKLLTFYGPTDNYDGESYLWNFGDGSPTSTVKNPKHKYLAHGNYNVSLTITTTPPSASNSELPAPLCCSTFTYTLPIVIENCQGGYASLCNDCMNTFKPQEGKSYIVSAWVKQDRANINSNTNKLSFDQATIQLVFKNQSNSAIGTPLNLQASGEIIDGWQRMEQNILIPIGAHSVDISLKNTSTIEGNNAYYDDIRIFPTDGSLKSYVYDPNTLKLVAELDENNYSTLYEYDEGGVLVRVKKETERGIITIKESGENKSKSE